jgi:hypothetical protein
MCEPDCRMCRWCKPDANLGALVAQRVANDNGVRHDLDDVIASFGLTRAELEADDQ